LPHAHGQINWSKANFAALEQNGELTDATVKHILQQSRTYLRRVSQLGYNAVGVDDLAHLVVHDFYHSPLKRRLAMYQKMYAQFFELARAQGQRIFATTDYLFSNPTIDAHLQQTGSSAEDFFADCLTKLFTTFPQIDGIILRVGERDGHDVRGDFLSRLQLSTPAQANAFLKKVLPIFEKAGKTLIFRTWTVGVHPIGDLIWNPDTFAAVFGDIASPSLIISMKFGDTDFMRYLALNPLFFASDHQKIIELQTRREWEGMGILPNFVGWDYQKYRDQLAKAKKLIGIYVWCQTGGWANGTWDGLTFLRDSSFWTELNTYVTARLFAGGESVEAAVAAFCADYKITNASNFLLLLQLVDHAAREGLYIKEFASTPLYFRRTRLPSLAYIMWDTVVANSVLTALLRTAVGDKTLAVRQGYEAAKTAQQAVQLAQQLKLPGEVLRSLQFGAATYNVLAIVREHLLVGLPVERFAAFEKLYATYRRDWLEHYRVDIAALQKIGRSPVWLQTLTRHGVRGQSKYRLFDRVLLATSPLQGFVARRVLKQLANQSMGIGAIFE